jgi:protein associated with RNAse G/E
MAIIHWEKELSVAEQLLYRIWEEPAVMAATVELVELAELAELVMTAMEIHNIQG